MAVSDWAVLDCGTRPDVRWWSYLANVAPMPIAQLGSSLSGKAAFFTGKMKIFAERP